jgi:SAM-dependent methyltransferase
VAEYALLILPASNRVYAEASVRLTQAELEAFNRSVLGGQIRDVKEWRIGGVPYVAFSSGRLSDRDLAFLSNLSSLYALFEVEDRLLRPLELRPLDRFDTDLLTTQRYQGKTNEHFTKLLLNVTILATAFPHEMLERSLTVLDPLCGRGTTLNQALMYGYSAAGIEIDTREFEAYSVFLRTWLKRKRVKHRAELGPIRRNRQLVAHRFHVDLGVTKERYKQGDTLRLTVLNADTGSGLEFFRAGSFDVVVTDAPYGVQHGSRTEKGRSRRPLDLLTSALPVWAELLRPGGAIGIAWNTQVARREQAGEVLAACGLEVLDADVGRGFRHRVDQSIVRDILVARKP